MGKASLNRSTTYLSTNGAAFTIHYWGVMPKHYDIPAHQHSFFEICYVIEGSGTYLEDTRAFRLETGSLFLSRPERTHRIASQDGLFLLYVGFELNEADSVEEWHTLLEKAAACDSIVVALKQESIVPRLWESLLLQAAESGGFLAGRILHDLAAVLLLSLLRTFVPEDHREEKPAQAQSASALFSQAKLFIRDNLSQPLRLSDTAAYLHISGRHLSRIFAQEWGGSYSDYVQNERLQTAAALLKTTALPIKTIAETAGFSSVQYFTRAFTLKFRTAPGLFRTLYADAKTLSFQVQDKIKTL
ncbi:AraC family transcriptional regulator [Paenibacillus mucilaginosus]|uniref:AraC family transcriptional regulator n=1 Tax=Paenibacillus mucilaginosus TaxID=61624 RepID=UPI00240DD5A5|nr:AraC family transcriptional regulator [Paenibacillus mucilaginosus]